MKSALIAVLLLGTVLFGLNTYDYSWPSLLGTPLALLAYGVMVAGFFATLLLGALRWRRSSRLWIMPSTLCIVLLAATWFFAPPLGRRIADTRFERHAKEYMSLVEGLQTGAIPCVPDRSIPCSLPSQYVPSRVRVVLVERCAGGVANVEFLLDTSALLVHNGYIFKGQNESCLSQGARPEDQFYLRHIMGGWYHFSDQPGL